VVAASSSRILLNSNARQIQLNKGLGQVNSTCPLELHSRRRVRNHDGFSFHGRVAEQRSAIEGEEGGFSNKKGMPANDRRVTALERVETIEGCIQESTIACERSGLNRPYNTRGNPAVSWRVGHTTVWLAIDHVNLR